MNFSVDIMSTLLVATGLGLLIGVERERRKGHGPNRHFAGIRTFTLVSLTGAIAQLLDQPWITAVTALLVASLALVSHLKNRSSDPGITTETALFVTFLLGILAVQLPFVAAGAGVVVAGLLAARIPLQRFSVRTLSEQELRDALILAGAALILLPLAPDQPLPWLGNVNPRQVSLLVVTLMAVQAAGHIAQRWFGTRLGLPLSGLAAGFVSSTATIAAMGTRARQHPELRTACIAGAWFSTVATSVQIFLIALLVAPEQLPSLTPALLSAFVIAFVISLLALWRSDFAHSQQAAGHAFGIGQTIGLAVLLSGITASVAWLQSAFGTLAVIGGSAIAGFADTHAAAAAVLALSSQGDVPVQHIQLGVLWALTTNTISKMVAAYAAGGQRFGTTVSLGLAVVVMAAWAGWAGFRP